MITINNGSIKDLFKASATGPFMTAQIIPLTAVGKLRVTCNWLYSSLNCDPNDSSAFVWQFNKIDDQHISLSPPPNYCINQTIYASVRDDINYQLQVQAPYSADWIKVVGRDEIIGFSLHDLSIGQFTGFNNRYIAVSNTPDSHGGHSGYRLKSNGATFDQYAQWFIGIQTSLQPGIQFSGHDSSTESLQKQLKNCAINVDEPTLSKLALQIK